MKFRIYASFSYRSIYYIHIPCPKNMEYTCYNCGKEVECVTCGHEEWEEGITYDATKYSLELQEKLVIDHECCECGSTRVEM